MHICPFMLLQTTPTRPHPRHSPCLFPLSTFVLSVATLNQPTILLSAQKRQAAIFCHFHTNQYSASIITILFGISPKREIKRRKKKSLLCSVTLTSRFGKSMERDFMGLGAQLKQEIPEEITGSGRSSTMEWSFSKKGSVPQLLSFDSPKEDKPKVGFEALASAGLITITTTEAVESYPRVLQNNVVHEKQGYRYTSVALPPRSFDSPSLHHHHEARRLTRPVPLNQTVSVDMSNPVHQSFGSPAGQNLISPISTQTLLHTSSVQTRNNSNCVVGSTEVRNTFMPTGAPAQLTIFYAGSVCVFDDVSPGKAQAIMLLAGDGPPLGSPPSVPASPFQTTAVRPSIVNCSVVNPHNAMSVLSSPISLASVSALKSVGGPVCPDDAAVARTFGTLHSTTSIEEPPRRISSVGSVPATIIPSGSAVPQFRKASLARFLEKRKERVLTASPYFCDKKKSQDCSTPGSRDTGLALS